jgi:hypothetical protein
MKVVVCIFDNNSLAQFKNGLMSYLGSKVNRKSLSVDDKIVCVNITDGTVFAVCEADNWAETNTVCRIHHLLDSDVYDGNYSAYNKYEIRIKNLRMLMTPVTFDEVRVVVGGSSDYKGRTNIWKKPNIDLVDAFVKTEDQTAVERYKIWVKSLF